MAKRNTVTFKVKAITTEVLNRNGHVSAVYKTNYGEAKPITVTPRGDKTPEQMLKNKLARESKIMKPGRIAVISVTTTSGKLKLMWNTDRVLK